MGSIWGKNISLSIFGESHGKAVGIVIDGLSPGMEIDWVKVKKDMERRAPGRSELSSERTEPDTWEVVSGVFEGKTTGTPLCALIKNEDINSGEHERNIMRPGHADFTARIKYGGHADYRGGGHTSGRLTAPLVFAGALAKQELENLGISIQSKIVCINGIYDEGDFTGFSQAAEKAFPVYNDAKGELMKAAVSAAKIEGDSIGGIIECAAFGLPSGWGDPFFGSLESSISSMMFSIPAVKGIEFGRGFDFAKMKGSEANDTMIFDEGKIHMDSNNNGGINGGISNGEPLLFRVVIKPTPTIEKKQKTIDIAKKESVSVSFTGRNDPCIVPRALPAVEAGLALCLLDISKTEEKE